MNTIVSAKVKTLGTQLKPRRCFFFPPRSLIHSNEVSEIIDTPDGGHFALDWFEDASLPPSAPILYLIPGINGNSKALYVRSMVATVMAKGQLILQIV